MRPSGVYPSGGAAALPGGPCTSFEDAYERCLRLVWSRICRATDLEDQWEDIVQDVFVVLHAYIHKKGMPGDVPLLLMAICENQIKNRRRDRRRSRAHIDPEGAPDSVAQPSSRSSPEQLLDRARRQHAVVTSLDRMPEHHSQVLRMTELEEISQREAAARMGCTEGTLRARHHRAFDYLRALLVRLYKKDSR